MRFVDDWRWRACCAAGRSACAARAALATPRRDRLSAPHVAVPAIPVPMPDVAAIIEDVT